MSMSIEEQVSTVRHAYERAIKREEPLRHNWTLKFMYELAQLALRGASDHPAVRKLIADTAPGQYSLPLPGWMRTLASIVEEGGDEQYEAALSMRSEMEFWRDFYRGVAPDAVELFDMDEIDETFAEKAAHRYVSQIPAGIPTSHVWWHRHASNPR